MIQYVQRYISLLRNLDSVFIHPTTDTIKIQEYLFGNNQSLEQLPRLCVTWLREWLISSESCSSCRADRFLKAFLFIICSLFWFLIHDSWTFTVRRNVCPMNIVNIKQCFSLNTKMACQPTRDGKIHRLPRFKKVYTGYNFGWWCIKTQP